MANPNFKGRPKGSGKSTFIEDPLLGKFKIAIDEYSFNVVDTEKNKTLGFHTALPDACLLYTSPSPRDRQKSRMPSSA